MGTYVKVYSDELAHHGIKGMKWGVRRYQTKDGSLTDAGKKRYSDAKQNVKDKRNAYRKADREYSKSFNKAYNKSIAAYSPIKKHRDANDERWNDVHDKIKKSEKAKAEYYKAKEDYRAEKKAYKDSKKNNPPVTSEIQDQRLKNIVTSRRVGMASKAAASVLNTIGKNMYEANKNDSTPTKTAIVSGLGYTSQVLQGIGNVAVTASMIESYKYGRDYWKV